MPPLAGARACAFALHHHVRACSRTVCPCGRRTVGTSLPTLARTQRRHVSTLNRVCVCAVVFARVLHIIKCVLMLLKYECVRGARVCEHPAKLLYGIVRRRRRVFRSVPSLPSFTHVALSVNMQFELKNPDHFARPSRARVCCSRSRDRHANAHTHTERPPHEHSAPPSLHNNKNGLC